MMSRYITGQTATRPSICIVTLGAIALAATAIASPVMAFNTERLGQRGSLMLEDIMPLIERSPQLKHEVTEAARKIGKKPNEVICDGMRFSRQWENLSAGRVAPYHCHFADDLWLKIRATVSITSASGKVFDEATREAKKNASRVRETNPNWKWTPRKTSPVQSFSDSLRSCLARRG